MNYEIFYDLESSHADAQPTENNGDPSQLPSMDNIFHFLDRKEHDLKQRKQHIRTLYHQEEHARHKRNLCSEYNGMEQALLFISRSRRTLIQNIQERMHQGHNLLDAYRKVIIELIVLKRTWPDESPSTHLIRAINDIYGCAINIEDLTFAWCTVSARWFPFHRTEWPSDEHITRLVPQDFMCQNRELSLLFGDPLLELGKDPRNGLPLSHDGLATAWENGYFVIIPESLHILTEYRIALATKTMTANCLQCTNKGGKMLRFRTKSRPAGRYAYFRFLITYMLGQAKGDTSWAWNGRDERTRQSIWSCPGPYVSSKVIKELAVGCGDMKLPPDLYAQQTFDDQDCSDHEAELVGRSLSVAIQKWIHVMTDAV